MSDASTDVKRAALERFPGSGADPVRLRAAFEIGASWLLYQASRSANPGNRTVQLEDLWALFLTIPGGG